ncbi:MAG: DNA methyltransferase, partial [Phycisphaerae bacterium]
MEPRERRQIGGHYTSERDILKVIRALFLDDLREEFERVKKNKAQLKRFHKKLGRARFLDPACGCGNFLVITYRELRLLEIEVFRALHGRGQRALDIEHLSLLDVDAFFGIEIKEWPARIAEVAMWLMDHQMNLRLSEAIGEYCVRLPLRKSPTIVCGNALRLDWKEILPPERCSYVLGNPPFVGKQFATAEQKADMESVCGRVKGGGILDYVTGWYFKATEYIQGTNIVVGFVSTNSISQGEQVGVLWQELFAHYRAKIHFAHRTFAWESEARGKAHVHVVIIGFAAFDTANKRLYDYEADGEKVTVGSVKNISPYLVEGNDVVVVSRSKPISAVPEIVFGNMPNDGGHLILTDQEQADLLHKEPAAKNLIRPFLGSQEFINGERRWCLWLKDASPAELRGLPEVMARVEGVRKHREASSRETTHKLASTPTLFGEIRQPDSEYLLIPGVSSETRSYIPIGFMPKSVIASNLVLMVPKATLYHFGMLSSAMHMAWVRQVCGRLESRYRYSNKLVYNNYPWPESLGGKQRAVVKAAAQAILDVRAEYQKRGANLAELYDPLAMPPNLVKAHAELDRAVDRCYRAQPFTSERQRVEFLFSLYEKLTAP